jgi:hypothetical protein
MRFTFDHHDYELNFVYSRNQAEWERSCRINRRPAFTPCTTAGQCGAAVSTLQHVNVVTATLHRGAVGAKHEDLKLIAGGHACRSCLDAYDKYAGRKRAVVYLLKQFDVEFKENRVGWVCENFSSLGAQEYVEKRQDYVREFHKRVWDHLFENHIVRGAAYATAHKS